MQNPAVKNPAIQNPVANLNIVLSKEQINQIVHSVIGRKGGKLGQIAIASDYCCVDASVGSSVAGPVSSVASSVSLPGPENVLERGKVNALKQQLQQNLDANQMRVTVSVPEKIEIK
ncbi:MAG TPA: hypothetical protein DCZ10_00715 [Pelotomaculum sp.]|nr:hypothetical protein [Pelotomaculum sp.]